MFTLGFDVAKDHLDGALVNRSMQLKARFQVGNTNSEITRLLKQIRSKHPKLNIGCEATGPYHLVLLKVCLELDLPVRVLNPLMTKQYTRSTIRGRKTDNDDALAIARLITRGEGSLASKSSLAPAKYYVRLATKITEQKQALSLQQKFLERVGELPTDNVFKPAIEELDNLIANLRQLAAAVVDEDMARLLTSIVGIGPVVATSICAEIGDIHRFPSARQLIAYAGLDPRVKQSGTTLKRNTKLTKRGSPELRRSLFLAANTARRYDPELQAYYQKKRDQGKAYTPTTIAVSQKLCTRIYAVLTRGTPYIRT
ncbi:MAG: IS110 family transposase, partial [Candidatus Saccharimonadales bacterium]